MIVKIASKWNEKKRGLEHCQRYLQLAYSCNIVPSGMLSRVVFKDHPTIEEDGRNMYPTRLRSS